jgi:methylenetetrahydrofolate dehydrogenase (NADP+)/methenyltetrahydrofolate cyclohydrolase
MPEAKLLEGKPLAQKIQQEIRAEIERFARKGLEIPLLVSIRVGSDPASKWYVDQQRKLASQLGIGFQEVPSRDTKLPSQLMEQIRKASDSKAHGIFVSLPLPEGFDLVPMFRVFNYQKDVEGIHPLNLGLIVMRKARLIPSTALAALTLIESTGVTLRGKMATIVGQSTVAGRPLQLLLGEKRATTIVCNTGTSEELLRDAVSQADIVIACAGKPGLVKGAWIKEGAIVIDIGTTEVKGKLVGDVEFEEARKRAGYITPVPGGVGPLTVTMLMKNLITAYCWQKGI